MFLQEGLHELNQSKRSEVNKITQIFDKDTWTEIFESIKKNRTRTVLTMLGVVIGLFIYIVLSGVAEGLGSGFEKQFESVSRNSMFVWAQNTSKPYAGFRAGRAIKLKLSDIEVLKKNVPEIMAVAPRNVRGLFGSSPSLIKQGLKSGRYSVYGDFPEFTMIYPKKIYNGGRFINHEDIAEAREVCVIGERTQKELFREGENPLGKYINIDNVNFQVVGIHKFMETGNYNDSDSDVFIPFTTYTRLYKTGNEVAWLNIAAHDHVDVVAVESQVKAVLRRIHKIHPEDEKALGSINLGEVYEKTSVFSNGIKLLSLIVGMSCILAGVIGIGSILLISVHERSNELCIRRALGATPSEIRNQIILEALVLILGAGTIGVVIGALTLKLVDMFTRGSELPFGSPSVPLVNIAGVLVIMVVFGILICLIPAQRAVSVRPIESLRED